MADTMHALEKNPAWKGRRGPVVLVIMDGVGYGKYEEGDAVKASRMKYLDWFTANCPHTKLKAHGTAVGLPSDDDMGNSEVGHNAMGCGRVFAQGAKLVGESIANGSMFAADTWKKLVKNVNDKGSTLHFIGLVSDGNVHSHIDHLKAMITQAHKDGVKRLRVHALLDGRDVDPTSALNYITPLEEFLASFGADYQIASGGGRMYMTMDGYNADWSEENNSNVTGGNGNGFNAGLATQLFGNYMGFWFAGHGADFQMYSTSTSDDKKGGTNSYQYTATDNLDYAAAVLLGLGNIGIKATMFYQPRTSGATYDKPDTKEKPYTQTDVWRFYGDVQVGLGDDAGTHFELGLDANSAKLTTETGYTDNSYSDLYLRGGLTLKNWDLDLDTRWRLYPIVKSEGKESDDKVIEDGYTDNLIVLTAARGWTVEPNDRFTLKAKLALPLSFGFYADQAHSTKTGSDTVYYDHTHNIDILLEPAIKLGAVYVVRPGKFNFNFGTKLSAGTIGWNIDLTGKYEGGSKDSAAYDWTESSCAFGWDSSEWAINWSSGFTVFLGEKVTFDAEWNILRNLFDGFSTNSSTFDGSGVDSVIGKALFTEQVKLLLTVKL